MRHDLRKLWQLFTPAERRKSAWMLFLVVVMTLVETAGVLSILPFLSAISRPEIVTENPYLRSAFLASGIEGTRGFTIALGIASIAVVVAASAFKVITHHALNRFVHLQRHSISARLLGNYLRQPYEFFLARNTAELSRNILSETDQLLSNMVQPLTQLVAQGAVVVAMLTLVVLYDPWMAVGVAAVVGSLYALIYALVRRRLTRIGAARMAANRERYQASSEALGGIKDVKITHSANSYTQRFKRASREYSRHMATNDTLSQTPLYLVEAVGYGGLILIALVLLMRSDEFGQVIPALGLYGFAAYRLLPAAQIMYRGFAKLRFSSPALDALYQDLSLPAEADSAPGDMLVPRKEIRLENVRFAYPGAPNRPIFDGFDLVIPVNASLGIIGRSGTGKSTLMDLLLGLLQPQAGTMRVDETVVGPTNVAAWQRSIGYVPQHIYLADASAAANIAFGIPSERIDMVAVERAARAAQIHEFIVNELPLGYDTQLGERGLRLSGGQRQRIGYARALYNDPPVLLMDEATSALDEETEKAVIDSIRGYSKSKTVILITHRRATLLACDLTLELTSNGEASGRPM